MRKDKKHAKSLNKKQSYIGLFFMYKEKTLNFVSQAIMKMIVF